MDYSVTEYGKFIHGRSLKCVNEKSDSLLEELEIVKTLSDQKLIASQKNENPQVHKILIDNYSDQLNSSFCDTIAKINSESENIQNTMGQNENLNQNTETNDFLSFINKDFYSVFDAQKYQNKKIHCFGAIFLKFVCLCNMVLAALFIYGKFFMKK